MKKFLLGVLSVILVQSVLNVVNLKALDSNDDDLERITKKVLHSMDGTSVAFTFTARCTRDLMGKIQKQSQSVERREWFECNNFQISVSDLIYGEISK
jgi:hypothetical protein